MAATQTESPASASGAPATDHPRSRLPFFPALEGLRGVAVAAVLLFHAGFSWMVGGYLGVSTFFTLSGFLITSLMLVERGRTASIDLRGFWRRRWRRILPAAFAALALGLVVAVFAGDAVQRRNIGGDELAAMLFVANWRFILSGQAYADLFGAPSPVLQFWSLAIEEQFYLVFPLLAAGLLVYYRMKRSLFALVLAGLTLLSLACSLFLGFSRDRIYFGTDTRASELLLGALLATAIYDPRVTVRLVRDRRVKRVVAVVGAVAAVACVYAWVTVSQAQPLLYQGGFTLYALASCFVVLACVIPSGPVRAVLSLAPVRYVGRISYGVYLYHWPVFLWLDQERIGWPTWALFPVQLAATGALAVLSYHFLEEPVRQGRPLLRIRPVRLLPYAAAVIAVGAIAVTVSAPKPLIDFDAAAAQLESLGASRLPPTTVDPASDVPPFPRIAMFGDSTALMTGMGLNAWANESHKADFVDGAAWLGCGIGRGGERRSGRDQGPVPEACNHWELTWTQKLRNSTPNVAVVQVGPWEVADRKLEGDNTWRAPGDPVYDNYLRQEMLTAVDTLSADGAFVVWLTSPPVGAGQGSDALMIRGQAADPARMARLNELIRELPAKRVGRVQVVDLAGWLGTSGDDSRLRPDGVHFGQDESKEVAERFLGPAVVDAYRDGWKARREAMKSTGTTRPSTSAATPAAPSADTAPEPATTAPPTTITYTRRRVLVVGDEAALPIGAALKIWGDRTGALDVLTTDKGEPAVMVPGCGIVATSGRTSKGTREPTPPECANNTYAFLQAAVAVKPDLVVVVPSIWDLTDNQLPGQADWTGIGDPAYDDRLATEYGALTDAIHKAGPAVLWVTQPPFEWGRTDDPPPAAPYPASDPGRARRLNEITRNLSLTRSYSLYADMAQQVAGWKQGRDPVLRPDGVVVGNDAVPKLADWLGPEVYSKFDEYDAFGR